MTRFWDKTGEFAPLVLRLGMVAVFFYFGISQLLSPDLFVFYLPKEAALIPLAQNTLIYINGAFEVVFGTLLLLGIWRRIVALLLGLHLMAITVSIGWSDIGARDFGLSIATLAVAMVQEDKYTLPYFLNKRGSAADKPQEEH